MAKLFFRYGAMNSGKTTMLIQTAYNYKEKGLETLVIKPQIDTKGADEIVSRIGAKRKVDYMVSNNDNLFDIVEKHRPEISAVLVDEAQFLTPEQVDQLMLVTVKLSLPVLCYGLRGDAFGNGFPGSSRLLEIAHELTELKTLCWLCDKKAIYNSRFDGQEFLKHGEQVYIDDGSIKYLPLCPQHFFDKVKGI